MTCSALRGVRLHQCQGVSRESLVSVIRREYVVLSFIQSELRKNSRLAAPPLRATTETGFGHDPTWLPLDHWTRTKCCVAFLFFFRTHERTTVKRDDGVEQMSAMCMYRRRAVYIYTILCPRTRTLNAAATITTTDTTDQTATPATADRLDTSILPHIPITSPLPPKQNATAALHRRPIWSPLASSSHKPRRSWNRDRTAASAPAANADASKPTPPPRP